MPYASQILWDLALSVIWYTWREHKYQAISGRDLCEKPAWKWDFKCPLGVPRSLKRSVYPGSCYLGKQLPGVSRLVSWLSNVHLLYLIWNAVDFSGRLYSNNTVRSAYPLEYKFQLKAVQRILVAVLWNHSMLLFLTYTYWHFQMLPHFFPCCVGSWTLCMPSNSQD